MPSSRFNGKLLEERGGADPHPGPLMVVGNQVAVEIDAHHRDYIEEVSRLFHDQERQDHPPRRLLRPQTPEIGAASSGRPADARPVRPHKGGLPMPYENLRGPGSRRISIAAHTIAAPYLLYSS